MINLLLIYSSFHTKRQPSWPWRPQAEEADVLAEAWEADLDRRLCLSSLALCLASFCLWANNLAYAAASSLFLTCLFLFKARILRFLWRVIGVMSLWIFGAFVVPSFLPSLGGRGRRTTYCRTSSSFDKLKSFLILLALFGPSLRGIVTSVRPGISPSPVVVFKH